MHERWQWYLLLPTVPIPWEKELHPRQWQPRVGKATRARTADKRSQFTNTSPATAPALLLGLGPPHLKIMTSKTTRKHSECISKLNVFLTWQERAASFRREFSSCISEPRWKELDLGGKKKRGPRYPKKGKILNAGLWLICKVDSVYSWVPYHGIQESLMDCVPFQRARDPSPVQPKLSEASLVHVLTARATMSNRHGNMDSHTSRGHTGDTMAQSLSVAAQGHCV